MGQTKARHLSAFTVATAPHRAAFVGPIPEGTALRNKQLTNLRCAGYCATHLSSAGT